MAESTTYWVCSCGKAVDRSIRICPDCGQRRPWRQRLAIIVVCVAAGAFFLANLGSGPASSLDKNSDSGLNGEVAIWQRRISEAPNPLAAKELLKERESALATRYATDDAQYGSIGLVGGIAAMQDGGGLSVTVGSVTLTAGVELSTGLDTLIKPGTGLHDTLLALKAGDEVKFSGEFAKDKEGRLVSLNYSYIDIISKPEYLFRFTSVVEHAK